MGKSRGVALVTGGGSGIGRASAIALAADGWSVVVAGRRQELLDEVVNEIGSQALAVVADVSQAEDVERLFDTAIEHFGRIDLLFNNAGSGTMPALIDDISVEEWQRVVDVNLTGSFLCARAAFGRMRHQEPAGGRIINNGSVSAQVPRLASVPYTTTKHAITGLTKSLALDGRGFGITCGQIDIGNAETPATAGMSQGALQADGTVKPEPVMSSEDVARAVAYMANLPPDTNVLNMTVMANAMPFVGRG